MAEPSSLPTGLEELQHGQRDLIDAIDKLRSLGVGGIVELPQIIVVGDQSSGKSSVLEAISQVKFPSKQGICTRFATQLSLRRSTTTSVRVSIPNSTVDQSELQRLNNSDFDKDRIPDIIEEAKTIMADKIGKDGISEDILQIDVAGPDMCPLTLVDLPGFYSSATKDQSEKGIRIVDRLAHHYMSQKSSIILTVVSGKYDIALQTVLKRVAKLDPKGHRTMGIITKADFVRGDSEFLTLARNEQPQYRFGLGWHALRNRTEDEAHLSDDERDANENALFQTPAWRDFPEEHKGIKPLRQRLSKALFEHINKNMNGLIEQIRAQIKSRELQLDSLGPARSNPKELCQYLSTIAERYKGLTNSAIKGDYSDDFFNQADPDASSPQARDESERIRKLRALVRDMNRVFHKVITVKGSSRTIVDPEGKLGPVDSYMQCLTWLPGVLQPLLELYPFPEPTPVPLNALLDQIEKRATFERGTEFPGSVNDALAVKEFKTQSERWESIATVHVDNVMDVAQRFVHKVLVHATGSDSRSCDAIMADLVEPFFEERGKALKLKVEELLENYKFGFPQPLEEEFLARLKQRSRERDARQQQDACNKINQLGSGQTTESIVSAALDLVQGKGRSYSINKEVIEKMMTYYDVSFLFANDVVRLANASTDVTQSLHR
jgi:GTP-binding protein EngB required for normal cell division